MAATTSVQSDHLFGWPLLAGFWFFLMVGLVIRLMINVIAQNIYCDITFFSLGCGRCYEHLQQQFYHDAEGIRCFLLFHLAYGAIYGAAFLLGFFVPIPIDFFGECEKSSWQIWCVATLGRGLVFLLVLLVMGTFCLFWVRLCCALYAEAISVPGEDVYRPILLISPGVDYGSV